MTSMEASTSLSDSPPASAVTAIMATFGRAELTRRTLESFFATPDAPPLIVIDNGSRQATLDVLREYASHLHALVCLPENKGKPGAWNIGLTQAPPSAWTLFLDNDITFAPGWFTVLRATAPRLPGPVGIVSGYDHPCAMPCGPWHTIDGVTVHPVRYPFGCHLFTSRDAIRTGTPFPEDRLIGHIDRDFARRLTTQGYQHYAIPGLVEHHGATLSTWRMPGGPVLLD